VGRPPLRNERAREPATSLDLERQHHCTGQPTSSSRPNPHIRNSRDSSTNAALAAASDWLSRNSSPGYGGNSMQHGNVETRNVSGMAMVLHAFASEALVAFFPGI